MLRAPIHVMYRGLHARSRKQAFVRLRGAFSESFAALCTLARECRWSFALLLHSRPKTKGAGERPKRSEPRAAFVMTVLGLASGVLLMKNLSRLEFMTPHVAAETMVGHALAASQSRPTAHDAHVVSQLASMCMAGADVVAPPSVSKVVERAEPVDKLSKPARHDRAGPAHATAAKPAVSEDEDGSVRRKVALRHEAAQAERAERAMAHFAQKARTPETKHEPRTRTKRVGTR